MNKREPVFPCLVGGIDSRICHFGRIFFKEQPGISACVPSWYNRKEFAPSHTNIYSLLYAEGITALRALGARLFMQGQAAAFLILRQGNVRFIKGNLD
jgi:hypothetical protein